MTKEELRAELNSKIETGAFIDVNGIVYSFNKRDVLEDFVIAEDFGFDGENEIAWVSTVEDAVTYLYIVKHLGREVADKWYSIYQSMKDIENDAWRKEHGLPIGEELERLEDEDEEEDED